MKRKKNVECQIFEPREDMNRNGRENERLHRFETSYSFDMNIDIIDINPRKSAYRFPNFSGCMM